MTVKMFISTLNDIILYSVKNYSVVTIFTFKNFLKQLLFTRSLLHCCRTAPSLSQRNFRFYCSPPRPNVRKLWSPDRKLFHLNIKI